MATKENRSYSRPAIKKVLSVKSESAISAVDTYLNSTLSAIYALDVILFFISDEATSEAANSKVSATFDEKLKFFNKKIHTAQKQVEEMELDEIVYTQEFTKEYLVFSPLCGQYIQLMKKFDILTNLIDQLWLNGQISSGERKEQNNKLQRHMLNVSRHVINASRTAMRLAQAAGKEKEVQESVAKIGVSEKLAKEVLDTTKAMQSVTQEDSDETEPTVLSA
ncbi:hypothetical protein VA249_45590 (plasmid) [Vibrio alfacsensis]|uniref:hypothetical protein n=1 Tax=Vibrio alfacsensis TaxID=1074311 RepID=UPI001BEEEB18|nr:hypothetical protein [Vibrio alfacsensis]BBM67913.1 hypothetical protein VA249_45590 [Vibrio alfacsensis]